MSKKLQKKSSNKKIKRHILLHTQKNLLVSIKPSKNLLKKFPKKKFLKSSSKATLPDSKNFSNFGDKNLTKEEISSYYKILEGKYFDSYGGDILNNLLQKEKIYNKKIIITEEILKSFNLTKEHRKYVLKYLLKAINEKNIDIQTYFTTVSVFDLFLINYYKENKENNIKICQEFFKSKLTNELSSKKLILFILCCFYLSNQLINTRGFDLKSLAEFPDNDELSYEELIEMTDDILIYIDGDINMITIYSFLNVFLFDIIKRFKILTDDQKFIEIFQKNVLFFSTKINQDIDCLNVLPSSQALGIILFAFEFTKFQTKEPYGVIDIYLGQWMKSIKNILEDFNEQDFKIIVDFLNRYVKSHKN